MLADAVFSKNALLSIGEGTPYIALLGRVPSLLPQLEHISGTAQLNDETGIEGSRQLIHEERNHWEEQAEAGGIDSHHQAENQQDALVHSVFPVLSLIALLSMLSRIGLIWSGASS